MAQLNYNKNVPSKLQVTTSYKFGSALVMIQSGHPFLYIIDEKVTN